MNFFVELYNQILYKPIVNLIIWFNQILPGNDFGLAMIAVTIVIKIILLPLEIKSLQMQKSLRKIQKQLDDIQKNQKTSKEEQAQAMMAVYQKEGVNPFASIGVVFLQLPFLLAVIQAINYFGKIFSGETFDPGLLYKFIPAPGSLNPMFLGLVNLSRPSWVLAVLVSILQLAIMLNAPGTTPAKKPEEIMQRNMNVVFAGFMLVILLNTPAFLGLYFFVSLIITFAQQKFINKKYGTST